MTIAATVQHALLRSGFDFQLVHHRPTRFSLESARVAHVPPEHLAKAVLLRDAVGYLLAVIPADSLLSIEELQSQSGRELRLARESDVSLLFHDCIPGAVPALGDAYGIETWVDERLTQSPDIYFDGGDHELLVRMAVEDFVTLLHEINYGHFTLPGSMVWRQPERPARTRHASPKVYRH